MQPLFDTPQFRLMPGKDHMYYGNVSNLLEVRKGSKVAHHLVEVHSMLFSLMDKLSVPVESNVTLYLDKTKIGWTFGIFVNEEQIFDLWRYAESKLPSWLDVHSL